MMLGVSTPNLDRIENIATIFLFILKINDILKQKNGNFKQTFFNIPDMGGVRYRARRGYNKYGKDEFN